MNKQQRIEKALSALTLSWRRLVWQQESGNPMLARRIRERQKMLVRKYWR